MKHFDTRVYSISDFLEWRNNGLLELSPEFQRRAVWAQNAKSYLIDTIVRGKPIPKLIISQQLAGSRTTRIVVDGQQRLRAILDFVDGNYKISSAHNKEFAGLTYDGLPKIVKDEFLQYEIGADLLFNIPYEEILDIFARINTYTVTLNTQEKRNAKYVGYFKQQVYQYGYKYVKYFIEAEIMTKAQVARMSEAELSAELFIALIGGIQSNKATEQYYKTYENKPDNLEQCGTRFDKIMTYIGAIYKPKDIAGTNWARIHLFYTLFTAIGHLLHGIPELDPEIRTAVNDNTVGKLREFLNGISLKYDEYTKDLENKREIPKDYKSFIDFSRRRTTDKAARKARTEFVCKELKSFLNN